MKRAEILATATEYVTQDRAAMHGDAEDSFAELGRAWGARLGVALTVYGET
jgi:hypothetical protein